MLLSGLIYGARWDYLICSFFLSLFSLTEVTHLALTRAYNSAVCFVLFCLILVRPLRPTTSHLHHEHGEDYAVLYRHVLSRPYFLLSFLLLLWLGWPVDKLTAPGQEEYVRNLRWLPYIPVGGGPSNRRFTAFCLLLIAMYPMTGVILTLGNLISISLGNHTFRIFALFCSSFVYCFHVFAARFTGSQVLREEQGMKQVLGLVPV